MSQYTSSTLKTGIEEGDSILKLLRRVSCPEIQLGVGFYHYEPEQNGVFFHNFVLDKDVNYIPEMKPTLLSLTVMEQVRS